MAAAGFLRNQMKQFLSHPAVPSKEEVVKLIKNHPGNVFIYGFGVYTIITESVEFLKDLNYLHQYRLKEEKKKKANR